VSWRSVALGEVCSIVNGGTPKSEVEEYWNGEFNWITPKEMGKLIGKEITSTERKITAQGMKNSSAKLLPVNSIILSSRAPIGHLAINKELMATNQGCKGIVPSEKLNYEYLYHFLYSSKVVLNDMGSGTTFKELSGTKLATLKIPLPSLAIQQKIVAKLDAIFAEIDAATAAAEVNAKNAEALFQSYLNEVFDKQTKEYKNVTVGEVCSIINGGTPKSEVSEYWNGDLNWITPKEMGKLIGREIYSTERKITDKGMKNSSAKLLPINSIILSSRAPIGHLAINKELMATNQGCKGLAPKESLDYEYLYYFLLKSKRLLNDMGSGTTFKELSGTKLATVILPLPNILNQKNTVSKLDMIFGQVQIAKTSFKIKQSNLTLLKQAILQRAFSGELVKD
jgi:type I restriction enzyme S subunit